MLKGFKEFILRGNVVDLAVGIVIGAAFSAVVGALVKDLITPLIGAIAKVPDFSGLVFTINGSQFAYGDFINAAVSFILSAASVYFFVVIPMTSVAKKAAKNKPVAAPTTKECAECKSSIHIDAKRCAHCAQTV